MISAVYKQQLYNKSAVYRQHFYLFLARIEHFLAEIFKSFPNVFVVPFFRFRSPTFSITTIYAPLSLWIYNCRGSFRIYPYKISFYSLMNFRWQITDAISSPCTLTIYTPFTNPSTSQTVLFAFTSLR